MSVSVARRGKAREGPAMQVKSMERIRRFSSAVHAAVKWRDTCEWWIESCRVGIWYPL